MLLFHFFIYLLNINLESFFFIRREEILKIIYNYQNVYLMPFIYNLCRYLGHDFDEVWQDIDKSVLPCQKCHRIYAGTKNTEFKWYMPDDFCMYSEPVPAFDLQIKTWETITSPLSGWTLISYCRRKWNEMFTIPMATRAISLRAISFETW